MRPIVTSALWLSCLAAGALAWPQAAQSQTFSVDYGLAPRSAGGVDLGPVRINPVLQSEPRYSGAGLSVDAGRDWFARVGVGRQQHLTAGPPSGAASAQMLSITGGYRFNNGQTLSLQLNRGPAAERLGLSINYEWPRYFVRLSYDTMLSPLPQDSLRFSAGVRF